MVGKEQQSPIYPMMAQVPEQIGKDYFAEHLIPPTMLTLIREGLLDSTIQWSIEKSMALGEEPVSDAAYPLPDEPGPDRSLTPDPETESNIDKLARVKAGFRELYPTWNRAARRLV